MTLQIKILNVSGKLKESYLFVSGSQAGTFKISSLYPQNDKKRDVIFSTEDMIEFNLCKKRPNSEIFEKQAFNSHSCLIMTQLLERLENYQNQGIDYDVQLFAQNDKLHSVVHMKVFYKRGLLFRGIIPAENRGKLVHVPFYKGHQASINSNAFNFLDFCYGNAGSDREFEPIEKVYRDKNV